MTDQAQDMIGLPKADTPDEVLGTMHYVLRELGRELGERYDEHLSATISPDWVRALENIRRQRIHLYDAHFVLSEPLKHADSPTRKCLPSGGAFYNLLEDALEQRNKWSHHEIPSLDLNTLQSSLSVIHQLATAAELQLGALCAQIKKRIKDISNGTYSTVGSAPTETVDIDELLDELRQAHESEKQLRVDAIAAQELLDQAADNGAENDELRSQLNEAQVRLEAALADLARQEFVIEGLASEPEGEPDEGPWMKATPGHPWPHDLPTRRVTLMALHNDLFDEATSARVAPEFSDLATGVIAAWKKTVPTNATIFLSPHGQAVTYVNGTPIYLGSLDEAQQSHTADKSVEGFFTPHRYTLRLNGSIEDRATGDTLSAVKRSAAPRIAKALLEAVPTGGRLRVTVDGHVARFSDGQWVTIGVVTADEWFPGHLP